VAGIGLGKSASLKANWVSRPPSFGAGQKWKQCNFLKSVSDVADHDSDLRDFFTFACLSGSIGGHEPGCTEEPQ
jgi:hypothetical protein